MDESIMLEDLRAEQCRKNAQAKSERKRQAVLDAILRLRQEGVPVTRSTVVRQAQVSYPFLNKHTDLLQVINEAAGEDTSAKLVIAADNQSKGQAIEAMKRRIEKLKQQLRDKDAELRRKQEEIDVLYGKLATRSELTDIELRTKLAEALERLKAYEN